MKKNNLYREEGGTFIPALPPSPQGSEALHPGRARRHHVVARRVLARRRGGGAQLRHAVAAQVEGLQGGEGGLKEGEGG